MDRIVELITDQTLGVLKNKGEVAAVGHRVVHGGETFKAPTVIDDAVLIAIKENSLLAPLHNPANVTGIEVARTVFKKAIQVAVFDTAFHHTIPPKAHLYALPYELYKTMKIRRYGFHGTSHQFVAETAAKILNRRLEELNLITIHLGNGGSITAVKNGKSIDTSMGMTPLEGLIMGTRSGDIDPAIPFYINNNSSLSMKEIDGILNKHSGLKGICGRNDMREIMSARDNGDEQAKLAIEMYCYRIKKYIGAYLAVLGKVDALIFTAGIGEHSPEIRRIVCEGLENLGIKLDGIKNFENRDGIRELHTNESNIKILLVPTNEELKIALATQEIFKAL
jgi:acetate kinase